MLFLHWFIPSVQAYLKLTTYTRVHSRVQGAAVEREAESGRGNGSLSKPFIGLLLFGMQ